MERVVHTFIKAQNLLQEKDKVLVGLSGGLDSMVLTHFLQMQGYRVFAVHINYHLRGQESVDDARFVKQWCNEQQIPIEIISVNLPEMLQQKQQNVQNLARSIRYKYFLQVAQSNGIESVAVAHHQKDQAETILLGLIRDGTVERLLGMRPKRLLSKDHSIQLIRPFLEVPRKTLEAYAKRHQLEWREDASNATTKYQRGFLRHEIFPKLAQRFGEDVIQTIASFGANFQDFWDTQFEPALRAKLEQLCTQKDGFHAINLRLFHYESTFWKKRVLWELLKHEKPSQSLLNTAINFGETQSGSVTSIGNTEIWHERGFLVFIPLEAKKPFESMSIPTTGTWNFEQFSVDISETQRIPDWKSIPKNVAYIDESSVAFPLSLRTWRNGDSLVPLGMTGKKNVSDILTDQKIPSYLRSEQLVLEDSKGDIFWVVGLATSEIHKITSPTTQVIRVEFSK